MTSRRSPHDEPRRASPALIAAAVIAAVLAVVVAVALIARELRRRATAPRHDREVIMFPVPDQPFMGPQYRVCFFDDQFPQLTDRDLWVALPAVHGPQADAALDRLARELAAEVERRDSQRCFHPRIVVLGTSGRTLREWTVGA
jgi:hypothetical protein